MNIAIFGAAGFLGTQLADRVLTSTDWTIKAVARDPTKLKSTIPAEQDRYLPLKGDVTNRQTLDPLLTDVDVAYYFVHLMGHRGADFYDAELSAARTFAQACRDAGVGRIIYMGGLGSDDSTQSKHLASRHRTGQILRESFDDVIELRASMIIGHGSVAFDIIAHIVDRMPVTVLPKSADTRTQPIALSDALDYLVAAATVPSVGRAIDIGGPTVINYADLYRRYAAFRQRHLIILRLPFIPSWLSGLFLTLTAPRIHARIGRMMVDSMATEMIVRGNEAVTVFPSLRPMPLIESFKQARAMDHEA